jgi:hypothetical protein
VPNTFIKPEQIVEAANLLLQREIVLPRTVWRQADESFRYTKGDTITLKVPAVIDATNRQMRANTQLVATDLEQTGVDVKLDRHIYTLLNLRDEELTLDIREFVREVLAPQIRGVAEGAEAVIATALGAATPMADDVSFVEGTDDFFTVAVNCRRELNKLNVPMSDRFIVLGADVEAAALGEDKLVKANEAGTDNALREAVIGRVAGFTVLASNAIGADKGYAYHRTAVAWASVAPALPEGAAMKASTSSEGFALRFLRDYDPTAANGPVDRSLVDSFVGATSVEEDDGDDGDANYRIVEIDFTGDGGS